MRIIGFLFEHPLLFAILAVLFFALAIVFWKVVLAAVFLGLFIITLMVSVIGIRKSGSKYEIILLIVVPMFLLISLIGVYHMFGIMEIDTSTQSARWKDSPTGGYHYLDGGFDVDLYPGEPNEIFNKAQYVSGWIKLSGGEGSSEAITVAGKYMYSGVLGAMYGAEWYEYYIYWSDDGENWELISAPGNTAPFIIGENIGRKEIDYDYSAGFGTWQYLAPYSFQIKGESKPLIKVEIKLHLSGPFGSKNLYATDIARMLSGSGSIEVMPDNDDTPDVYEAGVDTLKFKVTTEYSGLSTGEPDKGWYVVLRNPNGVIVKNWTNVGDNQVTYLEWDIPFDAYKPTWSNQYKIELYNQINKYDDYKFFVIDNISLAPSKAVITFGKPVYGLDEQIEVRFKAEPNDITQLPIAYFLVDIYYQDTGGRIVNDMQLNAVDNQAVYFFQSERGDVDIVVRAAAIDTAGRTSGYSQNSVYVSREAIAWQGGPGQIFTFSFDVTFDVNEITGLMPYPEYVVYQFIDPTGKIVYVKEQKPAYVNKEAGGTITTKWRVSDACAFQIPAFAKTGTWTVRYEIVDKRLGLVNQVIHSGGGSFTVTEGSIFQNLFAPKYFHLDIFVWDKWIKIPAFFAIILFIVAVVILLIVLKYRYGWQILKGLKKEGKK